MKMIGHRLEPCVLLQACALCEWSVTGLSLVYCDRLVPYANGLSLVEPVYCYMLVPYTNGLSQA